MTGRVLAAALLVLATGCSEATPPARATTYSFAIDCSIPDVCTSAADSTLRLIFRWTPDALPVRVWVEPGGDLHTIMRRSLGVWERAALYGEFRAVLTSDSTLADIIVRFGQPGTATGGGEGTVLDCRGQTDIQISLDTTIVLPFRITLSPRLGASGLEINECYNAVGTHELGHAFGLLLHSGDPEDLMFPLPTVNLLSRRDEATFKVLYHTPPTVGLPAHR